MLQETQNKEKIEKEKWENEKQKLEGIWEEDTNNLNIDLGDEDPDKPPEGYKKKKEDKKKELKEQKKKAKQKAKEEEDDDDLAQYCKVCFENIIDTVILDCGHQVVCQKCSMDIGSLCPLCREPIVRIIKTFQVK